MVEVCAIVYEPDSSVTCSITFSFNVHLYTRNISAGIYVFDSDHVHLLHNS